MVLVVAMFVAACGGDDSSSGTTQTPGSGGNGSDPVEATGEPIRVGFFNNEGSPTSTINSPEVTVAAQAAAEYINNELGGVGGRPFEIVACASENTAEGVTNCINRFVDEGVDVIVKGADSNNAAGVPIALGAGIPYVTMHPTSEPELTATEGIWAWSGGSGSLMAATAGLAQAQGWGSMGVLYVDVPSTAAGLTTYLTPAYDEAGIEHTLVPVSIQVPDLTPSVNAGLADDPDALFVFGTSSQCVSALTALNNLGSQTPVVLPSQCVTDEVTTVLETISFETFFVLQDSASAPDDPDGAAAMAAMESYGGGTKLEALASYGFGAVMNLYLALDTAEDPDGLDAETIPAVLDAVEDVHLFFGGGTTMTCDRQQLPGTPAACSAVNFVLRHQGGGEFEYVDTIHAAELVPDA